MREIRPSPEGVRCLACCLVGCALGFVVTLLYDHVVGRGML